MGHGVILTGPKLEEFGRALYGDIWLSSLSKRLRRSKRTILRWRNSGCGLPKELQRALIEIIDDQISIPGDVRSQIAETFDDG